VGHRHLENRGAAGTVDGAIQVVTPTAAPDGTLNVQLRTAELQPLLDVLAGVRLDLTFRNVGIPFPTGENAQLTSQRLTVASIATDRSLIEQGYVTTRGTTAPLALTGLEMLTEPSPASFPTSVGAPTRIRYAGTTDNISNPLAVFEGRFTPGPVEARVELCRDLEWPASTRPPTSSPQLSCGEIGWTSSTDAQGRTKTKLRIPWLVSVSNLAILAQTGCQHDTPIAPGTPQRRCTPPSDGGVVADGEVPGSGEIVEFNDYTCASVQCLLGARCARSAEFDYFINATGGRELRFVLETNIVLTPCATTPTAGVPLCPTVPETVVTTLGLPTGSAPRELPVRVPGFSLSLEVGTSSTVVDNRAAHAADPAQPAFYQPPLGTLTAVMPECPITAALTNALQLGTQQTDNTIIARLKENIVPASLSAIIDALLPTTAAPGTIRPTIMRPPAVPVCDLFANANPATRNCATPWATYALTRALYRYLTAPFTANAGNGPVGPQWEAVSWRANQPDLPLVPTTMDASDGDASLSIDGGYVTLPDGNVVPLNGGAFVRQPDGTITPAPEHFGSGPGDRLEFAFQVCATGCATPPRARGTLGMVVRPARSRSMRSCPSDAARLNASLSTSHDLDFDGVPDACDNCPFVPNGSQLNCNAEAEAALGRTQVGVNLLGDACDPNPCALITSTRVASSDRSRYGRPVLDHADIRVQLVQNPFGNVPAGPTVSANPVALRRCVCQDESGTPVSDNLCRSTVAFPFCAKNGTEGARDGTLAGFRPLDWSLASLQCERDGDRLCLPHGSNVYATDVTMAALQPGFDGTEGRSRRTATYRWNSLDEASDGRLTPITITDANRFILPRYNAFLWSRASTGTQPLPIDRIRDHYTSSPTLVPLSNGLVLEEPNRCLLTPDICRQIGLDGRLFTWLDYLRPGTNLVRDRETRFIGVLGVRPEDVQRFGPVLGTGGELASKFAGLVAGLYDPRTGLWSTVATNLGALPPVDGSAFASAVALNGSAAMIAVGGDGAGGPVAAWYEGAMTVNPQTLEPEMYWQRFAMSSPSPAYGSDALPSPGARSHASIASNATGSTIALFGGRSAQGLQSDLWLLDVASRVWTHVPFESNIAPRSDAAIAFDGDFVFVYGGVDSNGARLDDAFVLQRSTGLERHVALAGLGARSGARASIDGVRAYVYGGDVAPSDVASGLSNEVAEIDLLDASLRALRRVGAPTGPGAGFAVDDGVMFVVPTQQSAAGPSAFVGSFDALSEIWSPQVNANTLRCGTVSASIGLPCQAQNDWKSSLGSQACAASGVSCAQSVSANSMQGVIAGVDQWTTFGSRLVTASARVVREYDLAPQQAQLVREFEAPEAVRALYLGDEGLVLGLSRSVLWMRAGDTVLSAPRVETCGEVVRIVAAPRVLIADTTLGFEYLSLIGDRMQRVKAQYGLHGMEADPPTMQESTADRLPLTACRAIDRLLGPVLRRLANQRSISVDERGTLWVAQNSIVAAIDPTGTAATRLLGVVRFGRDRMVGRAIGDYFAVVDSRTGRTETLQWMPSRRTTVSARSGELVRLGSHQARAYVTEAPQRVGRYVIRWIDGRLEFAQSEATN
jgi:hypothetical protein